MKKSIQIVFLTMLIGLSSCSREGRGSVVREDRSVSPFTSIRLESWADVEIFKDSVCRVEVVDYEDILYHTITEVKGQSLIIRSTHNGKRINQDKTKVRVYLPDVREIRLQGSGDIDVLDLFEGMNFLEVSGSGDIEQDLYTRFKTMTVQITGSGDVQLRGELDRADLLISGSGDIDAMDLTADVADTRISGSGDISIHVNQRLDANISGSGNVIYRGNPTVNRQITGTGNVRRN